VVDVGKMHRRDLLRAMATGSLVMLAPACATNPETGRSQFVGLASDQMLAGMALQSWQQLRAETPAYNNPRAQARLANVGGRIAVAANRPNDPWEFVVFDSPEKNAFVLPGGKVGFYRGLMEVAERDDHIASVLGHEVGHVTGRHAAERFSTQLALQGVMIGAQVASQDMDPRTRGIALTALGLGAQVGVLLPFSRRDELEADRLGVDYMHTAGYDVRESVRFWELMAQEGGGRRPPEFLSTHPSPETRMAELRAYINTRGYATM
jgi:predicted Zn-dependent protease